jgi:hypothetical protein
MMCRRSSVSIGVLGIVGAALLLGLGLVAASSDRPDCPGKIECPLTGELVCRDQCPTVDPNRPDCPGRIICPLTGELICRDRCPLGAGRAPQPEEVETPSCCAASP